jgi:hypothetical protein
LPSAYSAPTFLLKRHLSDYFLSAAFSSVLTQPLESELFAERKYLKVVVWAWCDVSVVNGK